MGDGAAVVILEELEHARRRGAKIYAEMVGYGMTADAYHITAPAPDGEGAQRAMRLAMEDAGIRPEQVGYINAHGTSTPHGDAAETAAMKAVFGAQARKLVFGSTKSMTGHLLGAAGALEFAVCALVVQRRRDPAHHQPVHARSRLRSRLGAQHGRRRARWTSRSPTRSGSAGTT